MTKLNYLLLIFILSPIWFIAQNKNEKNGSDHYNRGSYHFATEEYEKALRKGTDSLSIAEQMGNSYYHIGEVEKSVKWYRYLQRNVSLRKEQLFRLALLERQAKNYQLSEKMLQDYKDKYGEDDFSYQYFDHPPIEQLKENRGQFEVFLQNVSSEHSDIGATRFSPNEVMLSSSRMSPKSAFKIDSWRGNYLYDIYRAPVDDNGNIHKSWQKLDFGGGISFNGPAIYSKANEAIYFTRNNIMTDVGIDQDSTFRLRLFRISTSDNKKFHGIEDLGINSGRFSNAHPYVSDDGKRLYFSSDRPGGFGGMDIYYVNLGENGMPIGEPVNMGEKINTPQDDMFPSHNLKNNLLFFASEGHFGLGGLDIFVARLDDAGKVQSIRNIGEPINSPYDDFAFIANEEQTEGYFSSNRPGGVGSDDIYRFIQKRAFTNNKIRGIVRNQLTNEPIRYVSVYLEDTEGNILDSIKTDERGSYDLLLNNIRGNFNVVASGAGYTKNSKDIKYDPLTRIYNGDLLITPKANYYITGLVRNIDTKQPIQGIRVSIKDNKSGEVMEITSDANGTFKTDDIPYKFEDNVSYFVKFDGDGYISKVIDFSKRLGEDNELNINEMFALDLKKIEVGKTDLASVVDIQPIYFDLNSSIIREDAKIELNKIVDAMKENPGMVIELGAHTDNQGKADYNLWLSDKRAKSSADYIISQGITKDRISGKGYGATRLIVSDGDIGKAATKEEKDALHQKNRRTEFIIVRMK